MNNRLLPLSACLATALLGLAPLHAGPSASSTIADLKSDYEGRYHTTNGTNQGGTAALDVTKKSGQDFEGTYSLSVNTMGGRPGAAGVDPFQVEGSVSPKGKLKMTGNPEPGINFSLKGTLSDGGKLVTAAYQVKQGKNVLVRAICFLEEAP
jgi:hypothetical protein